MSIQANMRYLATVSGVQSTESSTGKLGIFVQFRTDDGFAGKTIWVTEANLERAKKDLETLGATQDQLESWEWLQDPSTLTGATCEITTQEREYEGKTSVEVQWINPLRRKAAADKLKTAANLFRRSAEPDLPAVPFVADDDSIPF